jgi:hypothetical protein
MKVRVKYPLDSIFKVKLEISTLLTQSDMYPAFLRLYALRDGVRIGNNNCMQTLSN